MQKYLTEELERIQTLSGIRTENTDFELANQAPDQEDINTVKDFVDVVSELEPRQALTKLQQLQKEYPMLDKILDMFPKTRLVKGLALAVDSLTDKRPMDALTHLGGALGGPVATAAAIGNVAKSIGKGDYKDAARQAFNYTPIGRGYNRGQQMAKQVDQAANILSNPKQAYADLKDKILPQQEPAPIYNYSFNTDQELDRIRRLSGQA
jgi:hypothetical protein